MHTRFGQRRGEQVAVGDVFLPEVVRGDVQEGESVDLNDARGGGEQHELWESPGPVKGRSGFMLTKLGKNALAFPRLFRIFGQKNV